MDDAYKLMYANMPEWTSVVRQGFITQIGIGCGDGWWCDSWHLWLYWVLDRALREERESIGSSAIMATKNRYLALPVMKVRLIMR